MGITASSKECGGPSLVPVEVEIAAVYGMRTEQSPTGVIRLFASVDPRALVCDDQGRAYIILENDDGHARSMHLIRMDAQKAQQDSSSEGLPSLDRVVRP